MSKYSKEQQETLLQTIRANLVRNEAGDVKVMYDPAGAWNIIDPPASMLLTYFVPASAIGLDAYGNPLQDIDEGV